MCNAMASAMIIILISIASIAAITVEAVNIDSADKDWSNTHVDKLSATKSYRNLQTMINPKYNGLDVWSRLELRPRLNSLKILSKPTKTEPIAIQRDAGRRNRRQIDSKTIGEDGGSSSVTSLASSSSPSNVNVEDVLYAVSVENWILQHLDTEEMNRIREPTLGNRSRRLASGAGISSDKNTTASAGPTDSVDAHNMSAIKCLLSLSLPVSLPTQCIQYYFRSLFKAIH
ncbi:uncharacterized protein LOC100575861 [Acyrthosiphon pisum]|uniref:Uncharacterized protein n=1 Tax=Acyrthosiphon pisum TaxID=7029 RepID=A0A8R2ACW4_ACYPI|nr:uncharacterized protein LOC100575861 [Acyrthosiphon pisum]|eukprot:XP_003246878.3 PREDICTED: uncharacterized protein LOC100575861 [Acyrthosiphon pisum]